jgi:hypothetical protein
VVKRGLELSKLAFETNKKTEPEGLAGECQENTIVTHRMNNIGFAPSIQLAAEIIDIDLDNIQPRLISRGAVEHRHWHK